MITKRQLGLAAPIALKSGRIDEWYQPVVDAMTACQINTPARQQMFLAQLLEETGEFQQMEENLHYSAERIRQVFTGLLDGGAGADAAAAGGPRAVANYVYADANRPAGYKMGNNYPDSGWINRGRGPMQITGEGNYKAYFKRVGLPPDSDRDLLLKPKDGALSAATFWQDHGCNELADSGNFEAVVQRVNGGLTNLDKRLAYLNRLKDAMNHPDPVEAPPPVPAEEPPVTPEDVKLPPIKDTVKIEALPPVPPTNYDVTPAGNVMINDPKNSTIVKKTGWVKLLGYFSSGLVTIGGFLQQFKDALGNLFGGIHVTDTVAICITVFGVACIIAMVVIAGSAGKDRIRMWLRGIA